MFSVRCECVMIIRLKMHIDYQFLLLFIAISVPFVCTKNCYVWTMCVWLLRMCPLTAFWLSYVSSDCLNNCHTWATSMPVDCHVCVLAAISVPVDCHMCASCLPHVGQTTDTCGPHMGQHCKTRVAHMYALGGSHFNCHMWALCGPLVECLLGGLTGARLSAFEQAALVYTRLLSIWNMLPFLSQLTNVDRFSKGETTQTAIELACCMVSD